MNPPNKEQKTDEIKKHFYIMRGCPGSGKSTKAKKLAGENGKVFSSDDFFMVDGEYKFDASKLHQAHQWNQKRSLEAIEQGLPIVVVDNTNTTIKELKSYIPHILAAEEADYEVEIVEPETDWAFDIDKLVELTTHGVPKEAIQRMLNRYVRNVEMKEILF